MADRMVQVVVVIGGWASEEGVAHIAVLRNSTSGCISHWWLWGFPFAGQSELSVGCQHSGSEEGGGDTLYWPPHIYSEGEW